MVKIQEQFRQVADEWLPDCSVTHLTKPEVHINFILTKFCPGTEKFTFHNPLAFNNTKNKVN